jgi:hypothetical protein
VDALLTVLRRDTRAPAAGEAAAALANLCYDNAANQVCAFANQGCWEALCATLPVPVSGRLYRPCTGRCLTRCGRWGCRTVQRSLVAQGGIEALVAVLQAGPPTGVAQKAAAVLANLCYHDPHHWDAVRDKGGVAALVAHAAGQVREREREELLGSHVERALPSTSPQDHMILGGAW